MNLIYCNTSPPVVKTCKSQQFSRVVLVGLLLGIGQSGRASDLSKPSEYSEDAEAYGLLVGKVDETRKEQEARIAEGEKQRNNPGDPAPAAKIKAIDERIGAMVQQADQSAEKFPNSDKIQRAAGAVAIQAGDYKKGLAYADRAVTLAEANPGDAEALAAALRTRATGALWSGDYPKAAADAQRVLKSFPDDKAARSIYEMSKGRAKAGVVALSTTQSRPLANSLVESSLLDDPRLRAAGRRAGDRVDALKQAAVAMRLINSGDGAQALAAANATVEKDPTLADGYMMRGLAYTILKEFSAALREFTKAIDLWSAQGKKENLPAAYGRRAEVLNESKDYPNALRDAEKAVEADAGLGLGYFERARAREGLGEKGEKILADFKRAAELEPQYAADYASARTRLSAGASEAAEPKAAEGALHKAWTKLLGKASGGFMLFVGTMGALLVLFVGWVFFFAKESSRVRSFFTRSGGTPAAVPIVREPAMPKSLDNGRYVIGQILGEGGMGVVHEAEDTQLGRRVAVKSLRDCLRFSVGESLRFVGEAKAVAALQHPHIVQVFTIIEEQANTYIVYELIEGCTLHDVIRRAKEGLEPRVALEYLRQIASALDHAHANKVLHRDMKPSNVMVTQVNGKDWLKVMDFGIARQIDGSRVTMTGTIVGTPVYMAPEQEDGVVTKHSDQFSLGVAAYELLTLHLPFNGVAAHYDKRTGAFMRPSQARPGLPPEIDAVFEKVLHPNHEKRYARCAEFCQSLEAALNLRTTPK